MSKYITLPSLAIRRSREGAWIEIIVFFNFFREFKSRSREGAWIEILKICYPGTLQKGRSREGAWIEIISPNLLSS